MQVIWQVSITLCLKQQDPENQNTECHLQLKRLLQLRFDFDSASIRLRFDYDDSYQNYDSTEIRLRFDSSKWAWQYANEGMNSCQTTFYFGSVWKGYTNVDNRRMLPDVHLSAWTQFLLPWRIHYYVIIGLCPAHCLLVGYDASRREEKTNMFISRRSRIEAESQWNCSRIVILITTLQSNRSRIEVESQ